MTPKEPPAKKTSATIVIKKRRTGFAKHKRTRGRGGLPSFAVPQQKDASHIAAASHPNHTCDDTTTASFDDDNDNDALIASLPSTTMMVIRDLLSHHREQCLHIPLANSTGNTMIPALLECQLHARLCPSKMGRSNRVTAELDALCRVDHTTTNTTAALQRLVSNNDTEPVVLYLLRADYETAVAHALSPKHTPLAQWFLRQHWNNGLAIVRRATMDQALAKDDPLPLSYQSVNDVVQLLVQSQVLLGSDPYRIWVPNFGMVLSKFHQAAHEIMLFLKQSQTKERSLSSIVRRFPYCCIPISTVLLPWLLHNDSVTQVERPAGTFLKLTTVTDEKKKGKK